jgi:UDP-glucose 4-epimerase
MKRTLILGGSGFIGSNLAKALVDRGQRPRIFTRPSFDISNIENILDHIDLVYGDFMDDVALRRATKNIDTVFHLISTTFPNMTIESSVYDVLSNLLPTIRLVEICISNGIKKIIYASSGGTVYGEPIQIPISEDHPLVPKSAYGQSKLTIENYLNFCSRTMKIDIDILRISNPFGPGQNPFGVQGLIAVAMGCIIGNRILKIYGKGEAVRDYIFIEDVVNAMLVSSETPGSNVANISSSQGHSIIDIVQMIEGITGRVIRKEFIPPRFGDVSANILSNELAYRIFSWSPKVRIQDGLSITWSWFNQKLRSR